MFRDTHGEGDCGVVEVAFQGADDLALDLFHLVEGQLVFHRHFDNWQLSDDGVHVLHACSNATQLLGHAVAHGEPFNLQVLLSELPVSF